MKINPGRMIHRVEIQEPDTATTDYGEKVVTYSTVATRWAAITPGGGSKSFSGAETQPTASITITMRFFEGLSYLYRIKYGDRIFNIKNVVNFEERGIYSTVDCTEGIGED